MRKVRVKPLALDLFCGAGGASMGLYRAGFDVVGVDLVRQPRYPFTFVQADALKPPFDLSRFDLIWASPVCKAYSKASKIHGDKYDHPRHQISTVRKLLRDSGRDYVIENVVGAPLVDPFTLCGLMFGLKVLRHRLFETNIPMLVPPHNGHNGTTNSHRGMSKGGEYVCVAGHNFLISEAKRAMGINWMASKEISQAIPPAYSEFIGRSALKCVNNGRFA